MRAFSTAGSGDRTARLRESFYLPKLLDRREITDLLGGQMPVVPGSGHYQHPAQLLQVELDSMIGDEVPAAGLHCVSFTNSAEARRRFSRSSCHSSAASRNRRSLPADARALPRRPHHQWSRGPPSVRFGSCPYEPRAVASPHRSQIGRPPPVAYARLPSVAHSNQRSHSY